MQLWPGRSFHNSTCVATQNPKLSPKFCRNFVQLVFGFPQDWGNEKKRKRVWVWNTKTGEIKSCVEAHQWWKKPDLLSPKNQLQMQAHRFSLCCQLYTLTQGSTQSQRLPLHTHADLCSFVFMHWHTETFTFHLIPIQYYYVQYTSV